MRLGFRYVRGLRARAAEAMRRRSRFTISKIWRGACLSWIIGADATGCDRGAQFHRI